MFVRFAVGKVKFFDYVSTETGKASIGGIKASSHGFLSFAWELITVTL